MTNTRVGTAASAQQDSASPPRARNADAFPLGATVRATRCVALNGEAGMGR
jgi:hypothetical protein